jgi:RimJ/RimL family protein N-acetyltransferase
MERDGRGRRLAGAVTRPHVFLREVTSADVEVFFEHQLDPEATSMANFPARDRGAHFDHWAKILADPTCITRTVVCDGATAGNIGSWLAEGKREIGYWIGRRFWGRGVATEAVSQFIRVVPARPLWAWVVEHNRGSIRVLQKCGFEVSPHHPQPDPEATPYVVMELGQEATSR